MKRVSSVSKVENHKKRPKEPKVKRTHFEPESLLLVSYQSNIHVHDATLLHLFERSPKPCGLTSPLQLLQGGICLSLQRELRLSDGGDLARDVKQERPVDRFAGDEDRLEELRKVEVRRRCSLSVIGRGRVQEDRTSWPSDCW